MSWIALTALGISSCDYINFFPQQTYEHRLAHRAMTIMIHRAERIAIETGQTPRSIEELSAGADEADKEEFARDPWGNPYKWEVRHGAPYDSRILRDKAGRYAQVTSMGEDGQPGGDQEGRDLGFPVPIQVADAPWDYVMSSQFRHSLPPLLVFSTLAGLIACLACGVRTRPTPKRIGTGITVAAMGLCVAFMLLLLARLPSNH